MRHCVPCRRAPTHLLFLGWMCFVFLWFILWNDLFSEKLLLCMDYFCSSMMTLLGGGSTAWVTMAVKVQAKKVAWWIKLFFVFLAFLYLPCKILAYSVDVYYVKWWWIKFSYVTQCTSANKTWHAQIFFRAGIMLLWMLGVPIDFAWQT